MISPFGNATVLPAAMWHPEATQRGTFGILSSCLITISLCIWTAVHLNLPEHKKESQQVYRKFLWLALGLFAPEVVVWSAWRQRKKMKSLSAKMNSLEFMAEGYEPEGWIGKLLTKMKVFLWLEAGDLPESEEPREPKKLCHDRIHPWTEVRSWYAVMGGLAFEDTAAEELQFMPGNRSRLNLTDKAVVWMAENRPGLLPDISRQHIEDNSKSGGLGKFLTCWQASYFCTQCVFRLSQSYSISLLELNVFAHALCALLLFWIWWDKLQDILEPTLIADEAGLNLCAYLSLDPSDFLQGEVLGNFAQLKAYLSGASERVWATWIPCEPILDAYALKIVAPATVATILKTNMDIMLKVLPAFGPDRQPCLEVLGSFWTIELDHRLLREHWTLELDSRAIRRLKRAYDLSFAKRRRFQTVVVDRCADLIGNWDIVLAVGSFDLSTSYLIAYRLGFAKIFWLAVGLTLAGGCYGGLHLTAWTCQFPSYVETILWRAASITILATGPSVIAFVLCAGSIDKWLQLRLAHPGEPLGSVMTITRYVEQTLFLLWGLWYTLCRVFIVVECFIMLAHLPESTLEIPTWARYIPHIN
jgi:hypothetical protein